MNFFNIEISEDLKAAVVIKKTAPHRTLEEIRKTKPTIQTDNTSVFDRI